MQVSRTIFTVVPTANSREKFLALHWHATSTSKLSQKVIF